MRTPDSNSFTAAAIGALIANCDSDLGGFLFKALRLTEDLPGGDPRPRLLALRVRREEGLERLNRLVRRRSLTLE